MGKFKEKIEDKISDLMWKLDWMWDEDSNNPSLKGYLFCFGLSILVIFLICLLSMCSGGE